MAGIRTLQQGIQAIQNGHHGEGARLIRIALQDEALSASMRATGYIWLAETDPSPNFKVNCYQSALSIDPQNAHAKQRLDWMLNSSLPSVPPAQPTQPPPPTAAPKPPPPPSTATFYRTVGIIDGHNGAGTGFFVSLDGIIATTRYVVSGMENVTLKLAQDRHLMGKVIRSYPEYDLAFIQTDIQLTQLLPFTTAPTLAPNIEIKAFYHNGQQPLRGRCRATKREMKPHWFPTTIRQLNDAGGNPVFDEHHYVVGMLTRNASRSSDDVFGLHISLILRQLAKYKEELKLEPQRTYCSICGHASRAQSVSGFYCEVCGSVLAYARAINRMPAPAHTQNLYGENLQPPCRYCHARVGYYNGHCLRCGGEF